MFHHTTSEFAFPNRKRMLTHRPVRVLALSMCGLFIAAVSVASAEDGGDVVADGPWISAVAWLDANHLVGTRSEGLLRRPATVVKVAADRLTDFETLGEAERSLWCIQPTSDGSIVAADYDGRLTVFGGGDPEQLQIESRWIRALCPTPDGQLLAGTEDGKLIAFLPGVGKEIKRSDAGAAAIFDIAFNPAGDRVAVAFGDGTIKLLSWPALEPQASMSRGSDAVWSVLFTPDGSHLVSGGADRRVQLWSVGEASSIATIAKTPDWVTSLVSLPDSNLVAAGCLNGAIVLVDFDTLQTVDVDAKVDSGIWSMALSPDGQRIAMGTRKHGFAIMDVAGWTAVGKAAAIEANKIRPPSPQ